MKRRFEQLNHSDNMCLRAAEGWLELGDIVSAIKELNEISAQAQTHFAVLFIRYEIFAKAQEWDEAAELSARLTNLLPDEPAVWICFAYSTRRKRGGGIAQAKQILLEAESKFSGEYQFPFKLACYCSQLNQLEEAENWLDKAMQLNGKAVQKLVIDNPDLKPLRDSVSAILQKCG
jgi:tetratricopeptide (TPR) repeat protein